MSLIISQKFAAKQQENTQNPPRTSSTMVTENGKNFLVTTTHLTCLERLSKGIQAFLLTAITLFVGLCFQCVRDMWIAAFTGKEIVKKEQSAESTGSLTQKTSSTFSKTQPKITHTKLRDDGKTIHTSPTPHSVSKEETKDSDQKSTTPITHGTVQKPVQPDVKEKPRKLDMSTKDRPLRADKLGLQVAEFHKGFIKPSDAQRLAARDATLAIVKSGKAKDLSISPVLYTSPLSKEGFHGTELLGRFDIFEAACTMDYDDHWKPLDAEKQRSFFVSHAAAINIGESAKADDFQDYATEDGRLDADKYVSDMGKLFYLILNSQTHSTTHSIDSVWFPMGMGAFLRQLDKNDNTYRNPEALFGLKKRLAEEFFKQVALFPDMQIHLCLPYEQGKGSDAETNQNYNAFVLALANASNDVKKRVKLYINVDAPYLAQRLSNGRKSGETRAIFLANGANRNLIGNHWNEDGARTAIDENLHRRSSTLAQTSYVMNGKCFEQKPRGPKELEQRVSGAGATTEEPKVDFSKTVGRYTPN